MPPRIVLPQYKEYKIFCAKSTDTKQRIGWTCPADCLDCQSLGDVTEYGITCWYPKTKEDEKK